jgi:hypothetical protein
MIKAPDLSLIALASAHTLAAGGSPGIITHAGNDAGAGFCTFFGCSAAAQYAEAISSAGDSRQFIIADLALRRLKVSLRQRDAVFLCQSYDLSLVGLLQFLTQLFVLGRKCHKLIHILFHVVSLSSAVLRIADSLTVNVSGSLTWLVLRFPGLSILPEVFARRFSGGDCSNAPAQTDTLALALKHRFPGELRRRNPITAHPRPSGFRI